MDEPKPGDKYKHFKNKEYEILAVARDCENTDIKVVIYKSLYYDPNFPLGTIWSRPLEDFCGFKDLDGKKVKRFVKI